MVRFIHTADLQLILSPGAPDVRRAIQEARFETLTRIMEVAREREVDFVAICGDIFEDGLVSDETVHRAVRIFSDAAPMPVYIIPGNHDPLTPMSVYRHDAFRTAGENVAVLKTPDPVPVTDECALYPCPVLEKRSIYDPTAVIPPRAGTDGIRIGLAHEPEGCAGEFAATQIGLREALSFGGTAVEHGCVFGLLFVGTRFRLAVEFLLFGIGQPFGSGVAGWRAALDGDEVEFCVETVFHIA